MIFLSFSQLFLSPASGLNGVNGWSTGLDVTSVEVNCVVAERSKR
jgi:hypothetical protein